MEGGPHVSWLRSTPTPALSGRVEKRSAGTAPLRKLGHHIAEVAAYFVTHSPEASVRLELPRAQAEKSDDEQFCEGPLFSDIHCVRLLSPTLQILRAPRSVETPLRPSAYGILISILRKNRVDVTANSTATSHKFKFDDMLKMWYQCPCAKHTGPKMNRAADSI